MFGVFSCVLLAAVCLFLLYGKKLSKWLRALLITAACLLLLTAVIFGWLSVYYHADSASKAYLKSGGTVAVEHRQRVWHFDGPGTETALIFYPGAKVEATAYAPLLFRLAAGGVDGFLVEMPYRVALFDRGAATRIIGKYDYRDWILGGHSLGGVAAEGYARAHVDQIAGVVLLASYPTEKMDDSIPMLTIYGDQDMVLDRSSYEKHRVDWPRSAQELVIPGGNHAGFGNYGLQTGDGVSTITNDEQQEITAKAILNWLVPSRR